MGIAVTKNYEKARPDIERRLQEMLLNPADEGRILRAAQAVLRGRSRYEAVERVTGVPWDFIGVLHYREFSNDFRGILHNGEKILGTGRKTQLVPAGRGPFETWEEAAVDALRIKNLHLNRDWTLPRIAFEAERFNGLGYRMMGKPSPYVWSGSNKYIRGKYIRDHVYSPTEVDKQLGIIPILMKVREITREHTQASPDFQRVTLLRRAVTGVKTFAAAVASFFTVDNLTNTREWVGLTSDLFTPTLIAGGFVGALLIWVLLRSAVSAEVEKTSIEVEKDPSDD